jgi:ankyrin repeat protein
MSSAKTLFTDITDSVQDLWNADERLTQLIANEKRTVELQQWLESKKPNLNRPLGQSSETPLGYAVRLGNLSAVTLLLQFGADPNAFEQGLHGSVLYYLLFESIHDNAPQMIALMRQKGADLIAQDSQYYRHARKDRTETKIQVNTDLLSNLLHDAEAIRIRGVSLSARLEALLQPMPNCVRLIDLDYYFDSWSPKVTLLLELSTARVANVWQDCFTIFCKTMPGFKVDSVDGKNNTLLHKAAKNKDIAVIIIETVVAYAKSYFNLTGNTPLAHMPFLTSKNSEQRMAIHEAMEADNPAAFEALLKCFLEGFVEYRASNFSEPSAQADDFTLLDNIKDSHGFTLFDLALAHKNPEFLYCLIRHNILGLFKENNNLLHRIIEARYSKGDLEVCLTQCFSLLSCGEQNLGKAYLEQENSAGLTPLAYFLSLHKTTPSFSALSEDNAMKIVNFMLNQGAVLPVTPNAEPEAAQLAAGTQPQLQELLKRRAAAVQTMFNKTIAVEPGSEAGQSEPSLSEDEAQDDVPAAEPTPAEPKIPDCVVSANKQDKFAYLRLLVEQVKNPDNKKACLPLLSPAIMSCEPRFTMTILVASAAALLFGLAMLSFGAAVLLSGGLGITLLPFIVPALTQLNLILGIVSCVLGATFTGTSIYGLVQQVPKTKLISQAEKLIKEQEAVVGPDLKSASRAEAVNGK